MGTIFWVWPNLCDGAFPNSIQLLEFTQRPLLSGPPQFLLPSSHYVSRSGPPGAPLLGPGDFEPIPGLGRGQALPGAGGYGHQANVGGILPPGGRGGPADLTTPIFLAAGATEIIKKTKIRLGQG